MSETYAAVSDEFGHGDNVRDELIHEVVALRCQFATQAESLATATPEQLLGIAFVIRDEYQQDTAAGPVSGYYVTPREDA